MQPPLRISLLLAFSCETIIITVDFTSSDHRCKSYKYLTYLIFVSSPLATVSPPLHSLYWFYFVWLCFSNCFWLYLFVCFCFTTKHSYILKATFLLFYNCNIIWWCINYTFGLYPHPQNVQTSIPIFWP